MSLPNFYFYTYNLPYHMEELLKQLFPACTITPCAEGKVGREKGVFAILYKPDSRILAAWKGQNCIVLAESEEGDGDVCLLPCYPEALKKTILASYFRHIEHPHITIAPGLLLYPAERLLWHEGKEAEELVYLTDKETELLLYLCQQRGERVASEQLITAIWHYRQTVSSNTLATHMHRLRRKFGTHASLIDSSSGHYCLKQYL
jgi:hypothetical protein